MLALPSNIFCKAVWLTCFPVARLCHTP